MIMSTRYVLLLTFLFSSVLALPLTLRDVVSPPVTSPTASTVWYVGQTQTVTWNATGLPVNQTNSVGMLILGYQYNNSENLMLNSPLATNLDYSVGQAQITVPNVPTRSDYIVVLMGDSGNASPEFTIINDASTSASTNPSPDPPGSLVAATHASSANSPGNSGGSSPMSLTGSQTTHVQPTSTASSSQTTSHASTTTVTLTASGTPSSTQSSAAWEKYTPSFGISLAVALAAIYFVTS